MNRLLIGKQGVVMLMLCFSASIAMAQQEIKPDPRLFECFSRDYVESLQEQPRLLLYYNFFLDHAYFVSDAGGKAPQGTDIREISFREPDENGNFRLFDEDLSTFNPATFNALKYDFRIRKDVYTHYKLGDTGKVLVFLPQEQFTAKYNEYLRTFNLNPTN
ncbi:MAG TPA: hypothetical protein P5531_09090 [Bacteroidales bacterium]|nr:hypothetical protein [Bacteroidales bacterium]HSA44783.1 hypothetical protein [Bacteroidales bacterium]